ncbi:hypothetical protein [Acanthamoeba polyphaga mimivirus]|nr:hypothetical protein [Acanthamoeba castellanii mamavirus]AHA45276.1 hypothetical protein HIRU_S370 [Hirudovirus strain Sangsue]EJN40999.1 hypothetical protein lvs_L496 [Acanthamoeba polyphaga lentillevirus]UMZ07891.1 hypothetical protein [Acanthamoeba polyphaga mimivirus]
MDPYIINNIQYDNDKITTPLSIFDKFIKRDKYDNIKYFEIHSNFINDSLGSKFAKDIKISVSDTHYNKLVDNNYLYGAEITDFNKFQIKGTLENGVITFPQINSDNPLPKISSKQYIYIRVKITGELEDIMNLRLKITCRVGYIDKETFDYVINSEFHYLDNCVLSEGIISNCDDEINFSENSSYEVLLSQVHRMFPLSMFFYFISNTIRYTDIECYVIDYDFNIVDDTRDLIYKNKHVTLDMQELSNESIKEPIESSYYNKIFYQGIYYQRLVYLRFTTI